MKRYLLLIITIAAATFSLAASALTDNAEKAYKAERYAEACSLYMQAANKEGTSSDLYYNIGNAHYRSGDIAQAILAYERALRIDPSNADAKANLEFVNARIVDKKGETGSFLYNTFNSIVNFASSNTWAWTAFFFFALTIGSALLYVFASAITLRKIGFFGGICTLLISIVAIVFSLRAKSIAADNSYAIVTAPASVLSTVPRTPSSHEEEAMLLHEGTKVRILRTMSQSADSTSGIWHEVAVDNKHRAWINDTDIEKIVP